MQSTIERAITVPIIELLSLPLAAIHFNDILNTRMRECIWQTSKIQYACFFAGIVSFAFAPVNPLHTLEEQTKLTSAAPSQETL
jgi:hypothetical protein